MTQFASSSFTGTAGAPITDDADWLLPSWADNSFIYTTANRARIGGTSLRHNVHANSASGPDHTVSADVYVAGTSNGNNVSVIGRVSAGAETFYEARAQRNGSTSLRWELYKCIAGTFTQLGSGVVETISAGNSYAMLLDLSGTTIALYALGGGTPAISVTDSDIDGVTVGGFGVGIKGALNGSDTAYYQLDNFSADEAGGGGTDLTVPDSSHAHTLDAVVLTSSTALVVQDMAHGHALDAATLSTGTALTVADAQHAHALENVTLSTTGATSLTVADSLHAHALDAVVLTSQTDLAAADMAHGHALDGVTLTLGGVNLVIADIMHAHALDNVALTLDTYLAVADLLHGHAIDNVLVSIPGGTLDLILKILVNRQELNPATGTFTLYDNDGTTVLYTTSAWADAAGTVPYSGGALRRIDALF